MSYVAHHPVAHATGSYGVSFDFNYTSTLRSLASTPRSLQWPPSADSLIEFGLLSDLRGGGTSAEEAGALSGYSRQPAGRLRSISLGAFANDEGVLFRFERALGFQPARALGLFVDGRLIMAGDLRQLTASVSDAPRASFAPGSIRLLP